MEKINNISFQNLIINVYCGNDKNEPTTTKYQQNTTKKLEYYTWEEIDDIVKEGKHKELFNIGDTKSFRLGDETLVAQIADFDHDDLSDGTGKAGISFILKDCMNTTHNMNVGDSNYGGWHSSDMRKYLNNDIYNKLPRYLRSVIKPVNKVTSKDGQSYMLETSSDKLWLMSEKEVYGTNTYSPDGEGTQYPIFTDNDSRIKKKSGSAYWYWLRSPFVSNSACFCYVGSDGSLIGIYASGSGGVAFGFCI